MSKMSGQRAGLKPSDEPNKQPSEKPDECDHQYQLRDFCQDGNALIQVRSDSPRISSQTNNGHDPAIQNSHETRSANRTPKSGKANDNCGESKGWNLRSDAGKIVTANLPKRSKVVSAEQKEMPTVRVHQPKANTATEPQDKKRQKNRQLAIKWSLGDCRHGAKWSNDPSSATRRTGRNDCNRDAPAGFAAAHG